MCSKLSLKMLFIALALFLASSGLFLSGVTAVFGVWRDLQFSKCIWGFSILNTEEVLRYAHGSSAGGGGDEDFNRKMARCTILYADPDFASSAALEILFR